MPTPPVPRPVLPPTWAEALEAMERSLAQRIVAVAEPHASAAPEPDWLPALERVQEGIDRLAACGERAAQAAADSDALLAACAADLRAWLDATATTRQMLENWTSRPV